MISEKLNKNATIIGTAKPIINGPIYNLDNNTDDRDRNTIIYDYKGYNPSFPWIYPYPQPWVYPQPNTIQYVYTNCNHDVDIKVVGVHIVSYCKNCGKILDRYYIGSL